MSNSYYGRIDVYSNNFVISNAPRSVNEAVEKYVGNNLTNWEYKKDWKTRKGSWEISKIWAVCDVIKGKKVYRLPKPLLNNILQIINSNTGINKTDIPIYHHELPETNEYDIALKDGWKLRDNQIPVLKYIMKDNPMCNVKTVTLAMGSGKTVISMAAASTINKRVIIVIKPAYIKKWISDVQHITNVSEDDIMVVSGGANLKALMELQNNREMDNIKVIIVSNATMRNYLRDYSKDPDMYEELGFVYRPDEFFEKMDIGLLLFDEVHQDYHFNYTLLLYANVPKVIGMSGTLESLDTFIQNMHEYAFPAKHRYRDKGYKKYINVFSYNYLLSNPQVIKTNSSMDKRYSHVIFENSITKHKQIENNYLRMIDHIYSHSHYENRAPEDKCVIFCSTIKLIDDVVDHFLKKYPDIDVQRYISTDSYDDMINSDLIVSTLGSLGTAIDIPNLTDVIRTVNVNSVQSVKQSTGRLRPLEGKEVYFHYTFCDTIKKHKEYHETGLKLLAPMTKVVKNFNIPFNI